jgi:hypothetical protein
MPPQFRPVGQLIKKSHYSSSRQGFTNLASQCLINRLLVEVLLVDVASFEQILQNAERFIYPIAILYKSGSGKLEMLFAPIAPDTRRSGELR